MFMRISALIDPDIKVPVTMFVTSQHFAALADEMGAFVKGQVQPNPSNFKELRVGDNLIVVNSGSESQGAVNLANKMEAERANFAYRRDNFRTG